MSMSEHQQKVLAEVVDVAALGVFLAGLLAIVVAFL